MDLKEIKEKMKVKIIQLEILKNDEWKPVLLLESAEELHRDILSSYLKKNNLDYNEIILKSGQYGPDACGVLKGYNVEGMGDGIYDPLSAAITVKQNSSSYDYGCDIDFKHLKKYLSENPTVKINIFR